jgi:hypothetical protein
MKITVSNGVFLVRMPTTDLGCLCFLPEVRQLMARFPELTKINFVSPPTFIAVSAPVVPFMLATRDESPVLSRLRRTLRSISA